MKSLGCTLLALLLAFASPLHGAASSLSREEALSYFLLNCAYFGRWPEPLDIHRTGLLRIGILGHDPLGATLDDVADRARNSWFRAGRIEIRRATSPADLAGMHIILIAEPSPALEAEALRVFSGLPILLVGSSRGFASRGGSIEARVENERLVFELNLQRLHTSGVDLDSKMKIRAVRLLPAGEGEAP